MLKTFFGLFEGGRFTQVLTVIIKTKPIYLRE